MLMSVVINHVCIQVEMFGVTADETGGESSQLLDEFVSLQKEMFSALGLHYRLVHTHTHTDTLWHNILNICMCNNLIFVCVYTLECWTCRHRNWVLQHTGSMTLKHGCLGGTAMERSVSLCRSLLPNYLILTLWCSCVWNDWVSTEISADYDLLKDVNLCRVCMDRHTDMPSVWSVISDLILCQSRVFKVCIVPKHTN